MKVRAITGVNRFILDLRKNAPIPPQIKTRLGKVILSNDLLAWCEADSVSRDGALLGDARPMVATLRRITLAARGGWKGKSDSTIQISRLLRLTKLLSVSRSCTSGGEWKNEA